MLSTAASSPISWRSVTLGMVGVLLICLITPYNDYVLANTYVVGNNLPLGPMLLFFIFAIFINAPLSRYAPAHALTSGEIGVAFAMVLMGCSVPSSALMRYLPPSLIYPFWQARGNAEGLQLLQSVHVSPWLFPDFEGSTPKQWMNDPVVTGYAGRWTRDSSPPYSAWVRPMIAWGIYVGFLYGAFMFLFSILRRQWYENERLPFPLASIQLALVEAPAPGRWFNKTMSSRGFWICFFTLFFIHSWNGLYIYWPKYFPQIPIYFDLRSVFSEVPWRYADGGLKSAYIYPTAAAISFFLPGAVSFSLWFSYVLWQVWKMTMGMATGDPATPGQDDQMFGGLFAYTIIVIWIGRHHWMLVIRQALRGHREGEPQGRYTSYRTAFWGFIFCVAGMIAWMTLAGASVGGSIVITLTILAGLFIVARIVAETGLLQPGSTFYPARDWAMLQYMGWQNPTTLTSVFLSGHLQMIHHDVRETFSVFGTHAIKMIDNTVFADKSMSSDQPGSRRLGRQLLLLFGGVLLVAYVTSFSSMLWVEYEFAVQKKPAAQTVNEYASSAAVVNHWTNPTLNYMNDRQNYRHNPVWHFVGGAGTTIFLSVMRLRYMWWPLHPIGYLCVASWPLGQLWFAIFLGWLARTLALRFGGSHLYMKCRPALVGVIVGEAVAAGVWLLVGIILSLMGMYYRPVKILPD